MKHNFTTVFCTVILLSVPLNTAQAQSVTFSEVMFDAKGVDTYDEFIELFNYGETDISLEGAFLIINGSIKNITGNYTYSDLTFSPNSYALILDKEYLINNEPHTYDDFIPDSTLLITITSSSFGLLNTKPDTLFLISASGDILSSVITSPDQSGGYSDEKILIEGTNDPENWGNSVTLFGTPGFKNSISPKDYDLAITRFEIITSQELIEAGQPVDFTLTVKNIGLLDCSKAEILFGQDINCDSILQPEEIIYSTIESINAGDSLVLYPSISDPNSGSSVLIATVVLDEDESSENNVAFLELNVSFTINCLAINEFMYYPNPEYEGEWIELFNTSSDTLNLKDWTISDNKDEAALTREDFLLPSENYAIVANDSSTLKFWDIDSFFIDCFASLPNLNDTYDSIIVKDLCGRRIDAIGYSKSWGYSQGISLERKNPYTNSNNKENWGLSLATDGGTPGIPNSILLKENDLKWRADSIKITPSYILPGDSASIHIAIQNNGLNNAIGFSINLRYHHNIDSISHAKIILSKIFKDTLRVQQLLSDTLDWFLQFGGAGYLNFQINYPEDDDIKNNELTIPILIGYPDTCLIINEILYLPESGEAEWFEIFNRFDKSINLKKWSFKDSYSSCHLISDSLIYIRPDSFVVIASDENIRLYYQDFKGLLIVPESFPTLNNTADSLVLIDPVGHRVEALKYSSAWGSSTGYSIERKNPGAPGTDPSNWGLSKSVIGATPGYQNSTALKEFDLALDSIYFEYSETKLLDGNPINILLDISNVGLNNAENFQVHLQLKQHNPGFPSTNFLDTTFAYPNLISPGESITLTIGVSSIPGGVHNITTEIIFSSDGNHSNNINSCQLNVGYHERAVIINEIMYSPESGESEWFEIFNRHNDFVDLNQWEFRDASGALLNLIDSTFFLLPNEFAVVSGNADFLQSYPSFNGKLILPSLFPTLNNTSDSLFLRDAVNHTIEAVAYYEEWGGGIGVSIEQKELQASPFNPDNWGSSRSTIGATPGYMNSITPLTYDLSLDSLKISSVIGDTTSVFYLTFYIKNCGMITCNQAELNIYETNDISPKPVDAMNLINIQTKSTDSVSCQIGPFKSGPHNFTACVSWNYDQNPQNDSLNFTIDISYPAETLSISEFMPYPQDVQAEGISTAEYVELYNFSSDTININDWYISDENTANPVKILHSFCLLPDSFIVLSSDSSIFAFPGTNNTNTAILSNFPSLNNEKDATILKDPTGKVIDSLRYSAIWNISKGISLERVFYTNPTSSYTNWRSCVSLAGGTPGLPNSVTPVASLNKPGIKASPNPFSPDGDGMDDEVTFQYQSPFPSSKVTVEIYDLNGRLIYRPAHNVPSSNEGTVVWRGESKYGQKARIGIYIVKFIAIDTSSKKSVEHITTVVLAFRL